MYQHLFSVLQKKREPVILKADSGLIDVSSGEAAKGKQIP